MKIDNYYYYYYFCNYNSLNLPMFPSIEIFLTLFSKLLLKSEPEQVLLGGVAMTGNDRSLL